VRSSCDMLARIQICTWRSGPIPCFSFERPACLLDFPRFLALNFCILLGKLLRFLRKLLVVLLQFLLLGLQSAANCCDCSSRLSVCIVASMLLSTIPIARGQLFKNARCEA